MESKSKEAEKRQQLEEAKKILSALNLPYRDGNAEGAEGVVLVFQTQQLATDNRQAEEQPANKESSNDDETDNSNRPSKSDLARSSKDASTQTYRQPPRSGKREQKRWSETRSFNNKATQLSSTRFATERSRTSQHQTYRNSKAIWNKQRKLFDLPKPSTINRLEKAPPKPFNHRQYPSGYNGRRGPQTPSPYSYWNEVAKEEADKYVPRNSKRLTRHDIPRRRDPAYWDPRCPDYKRVMMAQNAGS